MSKKNSVKTTMPNHRIYKPSVYQKSLEVGTREKSQRSRKKTERYENTLKPNAEALKRLTRWTAKELAILVRIYLNIIFMKQMISLIFPIPE